MASGFLNLWGSFLRFIVQFSFLLTVDHLHPKHGQSFETKEGRKKESSQKTWLCSFNVNRMEDCNRTSPLVYSFAVSLVSVCLGNCNALWWKLLSVKFKIKRLSNSFKTKGYTNHRVCQVVGGKVAGIDSFIPLKPQGESSQQGCPPKSVLIRSGPFLPLPHHFKMLDSDYAQLEPSSSKHSHRVSTSLLTDSSLLFPPLCVMRQSEANMCLSTKV